jgi:hypothetical protein
MCQSVCNLIFLNIDLKRKKNATSEREKRIFIFFEINFELNFCMKIKFH